MERVTDTEEIAGHGIHTFIDGREVYIGNAKLMDAQNIAYTENKTAGTVVYVACNNVFAGSIVISDTVKEGSKDAIRDMKQVGVKKTVMLTGDRQAAADAVAAELGIDEVHAELLPADKVGQVEKLLGAQNEKERLAFVGDGINDAPVLTRADIGIAMGSMGSDAAIEAADIVLMDDDIRKIASLVKISKKDTWHRKTEYCICTCSQSSGIIIRCPWYGKYVGSSIRGCRSFCNRDLKLHAHAQYEIEKSS